MSTGTKSVDGGQLSLGQPLQRRERRLDPSLGADHVVDHLPALLVGKVERRKHLEVGPHRGQRRAEFVGGDGREIPRGLQCGPGALLLVADAGEHALDRLGDLDGLLEPAHLRPRQGWTAR